MSAPGKISDSDLNSYVDGELDQHAMLEVEAWIANHPDDAAKVAVYQQQKLSLHKLFDPVSEDAIPSEMLAVFNANQPPPDKSYWKQVTAAALLLATGSIAGWGSHSLYQGLPYRDLPKYVDRAMGAHVVYAAEVLHPVEVPVDQEAHLVKWLSKRIGQPLKPPSLTTMGFELIGGRLLEESALPAAQFMYEDTGGRRLTVYIRSNDSNDSAFKFIKNEGANAFYWIDAPFAYALVGDIPRPELQEVAQIVYDDLGL